MDTNKLMKLLDEMKEELCSADEYAKCYVKCKETDTSTAKSYHNMAEDELKHAAFFYEQAKKTINEMSANNEALAEFLQAIWDDKEDYYLDYVTQTKMVLAM